MNRECGKRVGSTKLNPAYRGKGGDRHSEQTDGGKRNETTLKRMRDSPVDGKGHGDRYKGDVAPSHLEAGVEDREEGERRHDRPEARQGSRTVTRRRQGNLFTGEGRARKERRDKTLKPGSEHRRAKGTGFEVRMTGQPPPGGLWRPGPRGQRPHRLAETVARRLRCEAQ